MTGKKVIYLDNAATTYCNGEVFRAMQPYFLTEYGNASSAHSAGSDANEAINKTREDIARFLNAEPEEIYFTSGSTEANNWILKGIVEKSDIKRIIVSEIEHPSILETAKWLAKQGVVVEYVKVDDNGIISVPDLLSKLSKPACLVSVMMANHEIGTIQYINTIAKICQSHDVYFHTDATQAIGSVHIDVAEMDITALSLSGHKIYGPKGVGVLYIKNGTKVAPFIHGGHQERGKRAGTYNTPAIVGLGKAIEVLTRDSTMYNSRMKQLRDYFITEVESKIEHVKLNGHRTQRLPGNVNFSFARVEGESIMMMLNMEDIYVSTGSACNSDLLQHSYVLEAIGVSDKLINGSIRFSLGRLITKSDIDYTVNKLVTIIKTLRALSPLRKGDK